MITRYALIGVITSASLAGAVTVCSAACPTVTPTDKKITLIPAPSPKGETARIRRVEAPEVGDLIEVSIPADDKHRNIFGITLCFDGIDVKPVKDEAPDGKFQFAVPATEATKSGPLPPGDHTAIVSWTYGDKNAKDPKDNTSVGVQYSTVFKPVLMSVDVIPVSRTDKSYRVELRGDGFDKNDVIIMDGRRRDQCWSDDPKCVTSPNKIRATVDGSQTIVLEDVDPGEETKARFQVCYGAHSSARCSAEASDEAHDQEHWTLVAVSIGIVIVAAGVLLTLLLVGRKTFMLWGERYILSVILLDKETETYSISELQFYIWTAVAVFGYSYLVLSRLVVQHWRELPAVPSGLPGIVGIAAGAAVGAQVVTNVNGPKGSGSLRPRLSDLITTGDVVAPERVQFLVWTLIGAAGFFLVVASLDPRTLLDLPEVPASILTISGISAFGYLGGKLARDAGPVMNEVIAKTGPDPDVVPPVAGTSSATTTAPTPAWLQSLQTAIGKLKDAQNRFGAVTQSQGVAAVATPTKAVMDSSAGVLNDSAKLNVSSTATDLAAAKITVDKSVTDAAKGAADAAKSVDAMSTAKASAADFAAAGNIAKIAQDAAKAVQDIQAALLTATPAALTASSATEFGLIELRGRTISPDATFKISTGADADGDFQLMFDRLEPSPTDDKHLQKPRVLESDASDTTLAKRLLLVIKLDDKIRALLQKGSKHSITVTNPDSQKAVFRFDVS